MSNIKYFCKYFFTGMAAGFIALVVTGALM